jgi:hypothetical protein
MAKTLLILILIAAAAFFIYRQSTVASSEEVQQVKDLQARFSTALNKFTSAVGRSGAIGIASTFDTESAVTQIQKIRTELADLRARLTEEAAISRADKLSEKIDNFCRKNDIISP